MDMPLECPKPKRLLADAGYDSDDNRASLLLHAILPVIKSNPTRKNVPSLDMTAYKNRNRIERMFNVLKQSRRIATRYDKTASSFLGFATLAAIKIWSNAFVHRA